jgi:hypothetical protein
MVRRFVISGAAFVTLVVILLGGAQPAAASSILVSVGRTNNGGCLLGQASGTSATSISQSCTFNGEHPSSGTALADYGMLGVAINAQFTNGAFTQFNSAVATASFLADGYLVTGPAGGTISTSLNLELSGFMQQTCGARVCIETGRLIVTTGTTGSLGEVFVSNGQIVGTNGVYNLAGLVGAGGSFFLTTPVFNVTVGTPFSVAIELSVAGEFLGPGGGSINDNLANTLTYRMGGPVFNLPTGYTVNGLGVTNNTYRSPVVPAPVPEPGAAVLVVTGLPLCAVVLRRRREAFRPSASRGIVATSTRSSHRARECSSAGRAVAIDARATQ